MRKSGWKTVNIDSENKRRSLLSSYFYRTEHYLWIEFNAKMVE